jgi:hypothetical protein
MTGRRIRKVNQADTTTYVYDAMGQLTQEYGGWAALHLFFKIALAFST